ncbi:MAG: type VII toxin-antitoxin system MntA family adenylyltransferase antitoxin [Nanoarchaeota archaeon]
MFEYKTKLELISKKYKLDLLVLFGSRAKNTNKLDSDWDFAFYREKKLNVSEEMSLWEEIVALISNEKVDLVNLNTHSSPKLRYEIFEFGKCIYERKKNFFERFKSESKMIYLESKQRYSDLAKEFLRKNLLSMKNGL